jgi:hypothetical protein
MPGGVHPPQAVIDSWPKPSSNPKLIGYEIIISMTILYVFTLGVVSARLWARVVTKRDVGLDDALIVAAMVSSEGPRYADFAEYPHRYQYSVWSSVFLAASTQTFATDVVSDMTFRYTRLGFRQTYLGLDYKKPNTGEKARLGHYITVLYVDHADPRFHPPLLSSTHQ